MARDGNRSTSPPVFDKFGVSPDGQWVIVFSSGAGQAPAATLAVPTHGGAPRRICRQGACFATWSSDGRFFYVLNSADEFARAATLAQTRRSRFRCRPESRCPISSRRHRSDGAQVAVPGARIIDHDGISPGPDPSTYVFTKTDLQRNLFESRCTNAVLLPARPRAPLRAVGFALEVGAGQERLHEISGIVHDRPHCQPTPLLRARRTA